MRKNLLITLCFLFLVCLSFIAGYYCAKNNIKKTININDSTIVIDSVKNMSAKYVGSKQMKKETLVPNEYVAAQIALAILGEKYGEKIYEETPYRVICLDSVWVVETSIPQFKNNVYDDNNIQLLPIEVGGIGHVEINKFNGTIYCAYHTK